MKDKIIEYYKDLHQIPEPGFKEFKTQKYILDKLKTLNCKIIELEPTGIIAFFDYGSKDSIAFRCEMDALEILERNDFDYKSTHQGYMHACGHDGHMAMILGLALKLDSIKCPKNIVLIFQPSEEKYGGALSIINSKILDTLNVTEIYGIHLWPNIKKGYISSKSKTMMASSTEIDITILGKETHICSKEEGIDAIKVATLILDNLKSDEVLFNCGKIQATGARNIVCGKVLLECSLRSFYEIKRKHFLKDLNTTIINISAITNSNIYVDKKRYIPILKNNLCLFEKHRHLIDEVTSSVYQSEDFSFYGEHYKTLFLFLGIGNDVTLHCSKFLFDLNVLEKGFNTLLKIAVAP